MAAQPAPNDQLGPGQTLYHVSGCLLPIGTALRPYALGQDRAAYLHLAGRALAVGSRGLSRLLAEPAWKRLRDEADAAAEMILLEAVFERVRVETAPESVSRLGAVFAWRSSALARRYRDEYRPGQIILRCVLVAGTAQEHDAALVVEAFETARLANPRPADIRHVAQLAVRYWAATALMSFPEVLVNGHLTVAGGVLEPGSSEFGVDSSS